MMAWEAKEKGYTCNDCYLAMQNCNDMSICCEDETGLCDWFEEIETKRAEIGSIEKLVLYLLPRLPQIALSLAFIADKMTERADE